MQQNVSFQCFVYSATTNIVGRAGKRLSVADNKLEVPQHSDNLEERENPRDGQASEIPRESECRIRAANLGVFRRPLRHKKNAKQSPLIGWNSFNLSDDENRPHCCKRLFRQCMRLFNNCGPIKSSSPIKTRL